MLIKPKVGILTTFSGSDEAFSLVVVVRTQLEMLMGAGYSPVLFVCPSFTGTGIWSDSRLEIRRTIIADKPADEITECLRKMVADIDVMICHDIVFLMPQHKEWADAVRVLAKEFPHIRWLHWQHSRGDHAPIEPVDNSEFCYPNQGDLEHVAQINSTTIDRVHYIPHPMDFNYLGWNKLAVQIAEDYDFPFVDFSMIYPTRLDRQKQVEKAVRIFAGLKRAGKTICLLVADAYATGERFKEYKADCLKIASEEGLTEKEFAFLGEIYEECTFSTPRQTVKALYEMSNLFIQVSNSETSSLVAMEAVLAGNLLILNSDFQPIHHLYNKALTLPFSSVIHPDTKYYRNVRTADGQEAQIEDPQAFWNDQARNLIVPVMNGQLNIALKRQQLRERWPSHVMRDYLEPLILKDWKPSQVLPKTSGDPDVTAIICSLDNLDMLKRQIPVLIKECGRVIVVSNGSKDGTNEWLNENPIIGVSTLVLPDNNGAGPGRNAGLKLWDESPTPFTLMIDGGILPPQGGVKPMKDYLLRHPEIGSISPEIASCYTTDEEQATLIYNKDTIDDAHTFNQRMLSGTAYCLCRDWAWKIRFSEEGPYAEPGWGVDDNDMAYRWLEAGITHIDFTQEEGMILFRKASGSFKRLFEETGIWPNQYGSVYEKRLVKLNQDYPQLLSQPPVVSCVVLGWNEYPMIARCVKGLHDELESIPHEIIVVDNGSTDSTKHWTEMQRYRQHWGDTTIDPDTKGIVKRAPENEETWTGNFIVVSHPKNTGAGHGFNSGFEKARGKYIAYFCGDMLISPGSVKALINFLDEHPDTGYAGLNAWVTESDPEKFVPFAQLTVPSGMGNYAYSYAVIRREIWDAGVRFADQGPFEGAGSGYEEMEFAYQMYAKGFTGYNFNDHAYLHKIRSGSRSGIDGHADESGEGEWFSGRYDERKKFLMTKWSNLSFDITHYAQPVEKRVRRIAMMNNLYPGNPGPAGFLAMAFRKIGCEVRQFNSLENPYAPSEIHIPWPEGYFDNFIFVDDGDMQHWNCPEWGHPSIYWTIDMYNPSTWPYSPPDYYINKAPSFDAFCCTSKSAVDYCLEHGINAYHLPNAANEDYHKMYPEERKVYPWIAIWSNNDDRAKYSAYALEKIPNGLVGSGYWGDDYPRMVNRAMCAISMSRTLGFEYPARVVETMMMGIPLVSHRDRFMDLWFTEDEHYKGFDTPEEMVEQINWCNDYPAEAQDMAYKAQKLVYAKHRYYHRALRMIGGW